MSNLFIVLLICFTFHSCPVTSIRCYQCAPKVGTKQSDKAVKLCSQFDWSSDYIVDCPLSTFCMKRNYTLVLPNAQRVTITERGCARQSHSYKVRKEGVWKTVNDVDHDIYQEGCTVENSGESLDKGETLYCFCSGNLCNAASSRFADLTLSACLSLLAISLSRIFQAIF